MSDILLFGGTTEGKKAASALDGLKLRYFYSTKTRTDFRASEFCEYIHGALDGKLLAEFVEKRQIKLIVNAAHPFAGRLHETVASVSDKMKIPVIRYERKYPERTRHPLAVYCGGYAEAVEELKNEKGAVLILTGVQTLSDLKPLWENKKECYARILPRESSVSLAVRQGFPKGGLITQMPTSDPEKEKTLFDKLKIKSIVTKESGNSGGQEAKIKAAVETGVKTAVIMRPEIPDFPFAVFSQKGLIETMGGIPGVF